MSDATPPPDAARDSGLKPRSGSHRHSADRTHSVAGADRRANDRFLPRWHASSIACGVLAGPEWHEAEVLDISLGGVRVRGGWDRAQPLVAVSLADTGQSVTGDLLLLQAALVWTDSAGQVSGLSFETQSPRTAAQLFRFLSAHAAFAPPR